MRFNETEEEFDARLEQYEDQEGVDESKEESFIGNSILFMDTTLCHRTDYSVTVQVIF